MFSFRPSPFNGQGYQKQKGSGTSYQCLFRSRKKFRKIPSDQVWWCNVKQFLSYSKNLCMSIHDMINHSTSIYPFESGRCGEEGKKSEKIEYLENKKSFSDKIKNIFRCFWRAIIWWKHKKVIKTSGHKL